MLSLHNFASSICNPNWKENPDAVVDQFEIITKRFGAAIEFAFELIDRGIDAGVHLNIIVGAAIIGDVSLLLCFESHRQFEMLLADVPDHTATVLRRVAAVKPSAREWFDCIIVASIVSLDSFVIVACISRSIRSSPSAASRSRWLIVLFWGQLATSSGNLYHWWAR